MKNNQVYLDPLNIDASIRQLERFYRLDANTLGMLRRVLEHYPKSVILYVDEANAPLMAGSALDDLFTFNTETGELVLFSSDPMTFVDAMIEMHMFVAGFDTLMGADDHWQVEFAIGAWKPIKNTIKRRLRIPLQQSIRGVVGLPPEPGEAPLEDPYPFKSLVSTLNLFSFVQMIRLAAREEIRVHFPNGTDPRVMEVYFSVKRAMHSVASGLDIQDSEAFNERLRSKIQELDERYQPSKLPLPEGWESFMTDQDAASGAAEGEEDPENSVNLLLGPEKDESRFGRLFSDRTEGRSDDDVEILRELRLANGPFGRFIDSLFDD
jgi:hypothetical protein